MPDKNSEPEIEVAMAYDIDTTVETVVVIIDGKAVRPTRFHAVPYGVETATKVSLREDAWNWTRTGTPAYTEVIDAWYASAEGTAKDDFIRRAERPHLDVPRGQDLDPTLWLTSSAPGTVSRRAAHAAAAVAAYFTQPSAASPNALDLVLQTYGDLVDLAPERNLADLLTSLLTDLRHLAEACEIRLESEPGPKSLLAMDLREMLSAIRHAAQDRWADALRASTTTLRDIEYRAFQRFMDTSCI
ncbi:hypothetical protein [Lentzea sp. CA-135723]|uniref:hypothetical protein n=1 Tax=Lentzea sp. CA-135723 TaxID=3239950 RepID=UPI003D8FE673